ncbi:hypothetical protein BH11BAC7_BH11BAC7_09950 [soil metagenome]
MVKKITFKIIWNRNALDNFKEILDFLSSKSAQAPKTVKKAVLSRLRIIKINALICETDKLKNPREKEFRAFVVYSYRISYQINIELREIRVIRIRHTSREPLGY